MPDPLCERIHEMISPLLDGELNRQDIRSTLEHICSCDACRAYLAKCIKTDTDLAQIKELWDAMPVPKDFSQRLNEKINADRRRNVISFLEHVQKDNRLMGKIRQKGVRAIAECTGELNIPLLANDLKYELDKMRAEAEDRPLTDDELDSVAAAGSDTQPEIGDIIKYLSGLF